MLVVYVCVVFMWEETGVNPPVWVGNHMTMSDADARYRSWVAAVRDKSITSAPVRQPLIVTNWKAFYVESDTYSYTTQILDCVIVHNI